LKAQKKQQKQHTNDEKEEWNNKKKYPRNLYKKVINVLQQKTHQTSIIIFYILRSILFNTNFILFFVFIEWRRGFWLWVGWGFIREILGQEDTRNLLNTRPKKDTRNLLKTRPKKTLGIC
jgi:hypothetical protein